MHISKRNVPRLGDLSITEVQNLFGSAHMLALILEKYYNVFSSNVAVQDGINAGQSVPLVHMCLVILNRTMIYI